MKIQFLMSSNPANLKAALEGKASATVEAEYGDACVVGSVITMAHHGPRTGQPAPCSYPNTAGEGVEVAGLSHFDLDTLGGCMVLLGNKPEVSGFWELAEFVDLNGPHKLGQSGASEENLRRLYAFWAWSRNYRVLSPRDGSVLDVTDKVAEGAKIVERILADDAELLTAGDAYAKAEGELNKSSFIEAKDGVVVRTSSQFVNHLYADPDGKAHEAVVGFNTTTGAITVSFADAPTKGKTARDIVQSLWGELAGGHAGIAGSPRDKRLGLGDIVRTTEATRAAIREAFFLSLEEKGWKKFQFNSEYYGSHSEYGEGDDERTYFFHPEIDISRWDGVRFAHGHHSENDENKSFDEWLEGLAEGEHYIEQ